MSQIFNLEDFGVSGWSKRREEELNQKLQAIANYGGIVFLVKSATYQQFRKLQYQE